MRQDFGSRAVIKNNLNPDYSVRDISVSITGPVDQNWLAALEYFTTCAKGEDVAYEVSRLRTLTAKRKETEFDMEMSIDAITEELIEYPQDIVASVCRDWARKNKFFPTLKDLIDGCEALNKPRQAMLAAARSANMIELKNRKPEPEPWTPPTAEEKARISAMVSDYLKTVDMKNVGV